MTIFPEMGVCSSSGGMAGREDPNVMGPFVKAGLPSLSHDRPST
jgi:hypothetical protein